MDDLFTLFNCKKCNEQLSRSNQFYKGYCIKCVPKKLQDKEYKDELRKVVVNKLER